MVIKNFKIKHILKKIKTHHLLIFLLFLILTGTYFYFLPVITTDTTRYHICAQVLRGTLPITDWHVIRGPVMPLILFLSWLVFGDTPFGFLITSYLFFLTAIFFSYLIIKEVLKQGINNLGKYILFTLFILLFVFNPLIIGYFHVMLTEFVAITISLIICFMSIKWISIKFEKENYKKLLIYSILFVIFTLIAWFLKQPYLIIVSGPFFLATIISVIKDFSIKNILFRLSIFLSTLIILAFSLVAWNSFLKHNVGKVSSSMEQEGVTDGLIRANSNFKPIDVENLEAEQLEPLIEKLEEGENYLDYEFFEVLSLRSGQVIDILVIEREASEGRSLGDAFNFLRTAILNYPLQVIHSYYVNYMSLINVNRYHYREFYSLRGRLEPTELHGENENIGLAIYFRESTFLGSASAKARNMEQYEFSNTSMLPENVFKSFVRLPSLYMFKLTFVLLPFLFTFSFLIYIYLRFKKTRESRNIYILEILIILFGFSILHVLSHVVSGAIVDRYTIVAYPTALLGIILFPSLFGILKKKEENQI